MDYAVVRQATLSLHPHPNNARQHTPDQVSQIASSLGQFGWTFPILTDENNIILAGHGRWLAARKLKMQEVPTVIAKGWTDAQKRAYMIIDNRLTDNSNWDEIVLARELQELQKAGFETIGFNDAEIESYLSVLEEVAAPETFPTFDETISTDHTCPKCGYKWSGGE